VRGACQLSPEVRLARRTYRLKEKELKELTTMIVDPAVLEFLEHAEEHGLVDEVVLEALAVEHDLDDEAVASIRHELDTRDVEVVAPPAAAEPAPEPDAVSAWSPPASTDSLTMFMNEIGRYPLLTAAEEVELTKRVERGDKAAKERMINSNLRLVVSIARRYQGHGLPLGDLVQEGIIGLNRAVEKFDWRRGYKFSTYATWWIRQAVQRAVANQSKTIRVPVHVAERRQKLARAQARFQLQNGRDATREELAELTGLPLVHVGEALDAADAPVSLNQQLGDGDSEFGDLFADESEVDPAEAAGEIGKRDAVRQALDSLTEQQRRVVELRFGFAGEPRSLEAIGKELGVTRERVRQLEGEALARLAHIDALADAA
jgi:RNA polymerase primary sigma factor